MNRMGLISELGRKVGITKKEIQVAIDVATETIAESLFKGRMVRPGGFGIFQVIERKAIKEVHRRRRKTVQIQGKKVLNLEIGHRL